MKYFFLIMAIVSEVAGSSFLNASDQFKKLPFTIGAIIAYIGCFYFQGMALKYISVGIAYALWSGLGIILTALVAVLIFKNKLDLPSIIGIVLILAGVIVINIFSKSIDQN